MRHSRRAGAVLAILLIALARPVFSNDEQLPTVAEPQMPDDATILRIFLKDGASLISYGEPARVGDRVVFSMPTSSSMSDPHLHMVNIAADRIDWPRSERYAEAARAARYLAGQAEHDYAALTDDIAQALIEVSTTEDPLARLRTVEQARRRLAEWPPRHFNYKQDDVRQMLGMLDEAIADLRAAIGADQFDLSLIASVGPPAMDPLLPLPTPQEAIESVLTAAHMSESPAERVSLMTAVLTALDRDSPLLSDGWVRGLRTSTRSELAREVDLDRQYRLLTTRMMSQAVVRSRGADVRGVERLLTQVQSRDRELGEKRPEAVASLTASIQTHLEAARQLRLARDRWALRQPEFRRYGAAISQPVDRLRRLNSSLLDIKALAGSSPVTLESIESASAQALQVLSSVVPPEEFRVAHTLIVSAAHMADQAAQMRREAALSGDMSRAWDASSAAAGALMLQARARSEMQALFRIPQLPR